MSYGDHRQSAAGSGHKLEADRKAASVGCADCHEKLWEAAQADGTASAKRGSACAADNIRAYRKSYHARPNKEDKSRVNATCDDCHNTHTFNIPTRTDEPAHSEWRIASAASCAEKCHEEELDDYTESIHGKEASKKRTLKSAVCADCHTTHDISNTSADLVQAAHHRELRQLPHRKTTQSYSDTYHGQVSTLGYAYTAKCFDCHGSHGILKADDPESKVHPDNRLKTCQECHDGKKDVAEATAGFVTFEPHANTRRLRALSADVDRLPNSWSPC